MTYIYNISRPLGRGLPNVTYDFYERQSWDRLTWLYGPDRANAILDGHDAKTNADLGAHACRWPYGDPDRAGFGFCGKPTAGDGPYCSSCIQDHKPYQRPTGFLSDRRLLDTGRKHRRTNAPTFDDYERKAGRA